MLEYFSLGSRGSKTRARACAISLARVLEFLLRVSRVALCWFSPHHDGERHDCARQASPEVNWPYWALTSSYSAYLEVMAQAARTR